MLTVASSGFGKRTSAYEYRVTGRGGKGVELMRPGQGRRRSSRPSPCSTDDQIMLVTDGGTLIRCPVDGIRIAGRGTRGVRIVNVERGRARGFCRAHRRGRCQAEDGNGNGNGDGPRRNNGG